MLMLSEYAKDMIRYHFHLLLQEKIYPTTSRLLSRLHQDFDDFPILSVTTLWREMKKVSIRLALDFLEMKKLSF
jgi:hypothetical protein